MSSCTSTDLVGEVVNCEEAAGYSFTVHYGVQCSSAVVLAS